MGSNEHVKKIEPLVTSAVMDQWYETTSVTEGTYTHTSLDAPSGRFYVSKIDHTLFMTDYIEHVLCNNGVACLAEYIGNQSPRPVMADIDLIGPTSIIPTLTRKNKKHLYGNSTIKRIVRCYQRSLRKVITNPSATNLICVVLEKPSWRKEGERVRDGFHLHFPFCITEPWVQKEPLYEFVLEEIQADQVLNESRVKQWLDDEHKADIRKVVDNIATQSSILMYGSRKRATDEFAWKATMCYDENGDKMDLEQLIDRDPRYRNAYIEIEDDDDYVSDSDSDYSEDSLEANNSFAPTRERDPSVLNLVLNPRSYSGDFHHILPILLSSLGKAVNAMPQPQISERFRSCVSLSQPSNGLIRAVTEPREPSSPDHSSNKTEALIAGEYIHIEGDEPIYIPKPEEAPNDNLKRAAQLIPLLNPERADAYNSWISVGLNLYSIGRGHKYAYQLWLAFSTQSGKFNRHVCRNKWQTFSSKSSFTIRTLYAWARSDNPQGLREVQKTSMPRIVQELIMSGGSHYDCARLLKDLYGDQFVCASIKHNIWYQYKDNKWHIVEQGHTLQLYIARYLSMALFDADSAIREQTHASMGDGSDFDIVNRMAGSAARNEVVAKIQKNLRNNGYQRSVMCQASMLFYSEGFVGKLDQNPWLVGYDNGVLDLENQVFVPGTPDHFVSMSTGCDFVMDYTDDHPDVAQLYSIYGRIFPTKDLFEAWWILAASCLYGGNPDKIVPFLTGIGNNAKSTVVDHLTMVLGDYFCIMPPEFLTQKNKDSGNARPDLWRTQGRRIIAVLETGDDARVNEGLFRRVSGNDKMYARTLYAEGADIKPMFTVFVVANRLPQIKSVLPATWSRVFVLPHVSKFTNEAPTSARDQMKDHHFPIDPEIMMKFERTKSAMHWILFKYWKKYRNQGLYRPKMVQRAIESYKLRNDYYGRFLKENVIPDPSGSLAIAETYSRFKDWYSEGYPRARIPTRDSFRDYLDVKWGPRRRNRWHGYRWREIGDDEDDDEMAIGDDRDDGEDESDEVILERIMSGL